MTFLRFLCICEIIVLIMLRKIFWLASRRGGGTRSNKSILLRFLISLLQRFVLLFPFWLGQHANQGSTICYQGKMSLQLKAALTSNEGRSVSFSTGTDVPVVCGSVSSGRLVIASSSSDLDCVIVFSLSGRLSPT